MAAKHDDSTADREIVLTHTFDAPRELVWEAYTRVDQVAEWWGPNGYTITIHEMNVAVGGVWRFAMHGPHGKDYPNKVVYREIVKPERLVFEHMEDTPNPQIRFDVTITFEDVGGRTKVTMRQLYATREPRDAAIKFGAVELGQQTLAKLATFLAKRA
jgi:uncharacterized protein YndB with AHSA1/START domain